jgi:very-short-patch-repair endonuclease
MRELEKTMYYNARPKIMEAAKLLRENMTSPENLLWERLKGKQICGLRFRRQHPIDIFIADFYCHEARLVVEIDGEVHNLQKDYDIGRTAEMEKYDILVIRFTNNEVITEIVEVVSKIEETVKERIKSPPWGI